MCDVNTYILYAYNNNMYLRSLCVCVCAFSGRHVTLIVLFSVSVAAKSEPVTAGCGKEFISIVAVAAAAAAVAFQT